MFFDFLSVGMKHYDKLWFKWMVKVIFIQRVKEYLLV